MEELKIVDGEVYKKVDTSELDNEIVRREDEIVRFEGVLEKLRTELSELKGKKEVIDEVKVSE